MKELEESLADFYDKEKTEDFFHELSQLSPMWLEEDVFNSSPRTREGLIGSTVSELSPSSKVSPTNIEGKEEQLLDEDVDWIPVFSHSQQAGKSSVTCPPVTPNTQSDGIGRCIDLGNGIWQHIPHHMSLKSLHTYFHFKDLLNAKANLFKHSPNTVFEVFARVIHSTRENFTRKQYFQFRDLFKEAPPYLAGALSD